MSFNSEKIHELYPEAENLMIEPMLIWKLPAGKESMLSEVCSNGEYFLEEKIDGAFYQFVKTKSYSYLFGRTVSKVSGILTEKSANVPHIMSALSCLPEKSILIGEIYYPGGTSKTVTSIMGCLPNLALKRQGNNPIHYYVHDIILYDGINLMETGAEDRYNILAAIWEKHNLSQYSFLRLATKVDTDLKKEIHNILDRGGEGAVLKKRNYPYAPGKRPAWSTIKIKQEDDIDLVCIGFCDATKEYTGKELKIWQYWEHNGKLFYGNPDIIPEISLDETDEEYELKLKKALGEDWIPITKYYYNGWKTAIEVGAYDREGKLIKIGTVSSGLTDETKRIMTTHPENYLNKVVTLDCMSIDRENHTIRHPTLRCWREDKDAKDCIISEVFA